MNKLASYAAAGLLGAGLVLALQSRAVTDTATMLMQLKTGDYEGLRNYLEIVDSDNEARADRWAKRLAELQARLDRLDQHAAQADAQVAALRRQVTEAGHEVYAPFTVLDDSGKKILSVSAPAAGGMVQIWNTANTAPALSLYPMQDGGRVMVHNAAGQVVAASGATAEGGMVSVMGPAGGNSAVKLAVEKSGGTVKVYKVGGGPAKAAAGGAPPGSTAPLAELSASDGYGAVSVYQAGKVSGIFYSAGGRVAGFLELNGGDDKKVVDMGPDENGVGMVRAGPSSRGPAGVVGAGLSVASELRGTNKK